MASVSSLDQDMRNLRLSRYTPQAANEVRKWIEAILGESLPSGDLLDVLKDGVLLCRLVNLVIPSPGVKYKQSPMPFIQMENISHFLKVCEMPPLEMPAHDRFLTVDLFESKDPAQVMQCLSAFSRKAQALKPSVFTTTIGSKKASGALSPTATGSGPTSRSGWSQSSAYRRSPSPTKVSAAMPGSARPLSPSLTGGSNGSQSAEGAAKSPLGPTSSWSKKTDERNTSPAWNIHQYGYMGGASQGNQGISFGARRQITSQTPAVPSLAEKERLRKSKAAEEEKRRQESEEAERRRQSQLVDEERRAKEAEDERWEDETRRAREEERRRVEEQKRQWAEQERRWQEEEEVRRKENAELQALQKKPPEKPRVPSSSILRGQTLSQYQKELGRSTDGSAASPETPEQRRVKELERQLEEARERERQYQIEREERSRKDSSRPSSSSTQTPRPQSSAQVSEVSWTADEREYLRKQWEVTQSPAASHQAQIETVQDAAPAEANNSLPDPSPHDGTAETVRPESEDIPRGLQSSDSAASLPRVPLSMQPSDSASSIPRLNPDSAPTSSPLGSTNRPLPTPEKEFQSFSLDSQKPIIRTEQVSSPALKTSQLMNPRIASQQRTPTPGGGGSKSLLEREMERERERQREWEINQAEVKSAPRDNAQGTGEGQSWDVNQYGYMGGDGMNRGSSAGSGINFGGRRQILGPREMKR